MLGTSPTQLYLYFQPILPSAGFHDDNNHSLISVPSSSLLHIWSVKVHVCIPVILISSNVKLGIQI